MEDKVQIAGLRRHDIVFGRVTVITAVYNAAPTLIRCIESVIAQDYPDVEHILMDGGSTDGTVNILRRYVNRVIWRSERDKGIYDAWNKSLAIATGEWIAFLGADDFYLPGAISAYMNSAKEGDVEYISSRVRWVQPSGRSEIIGERWGWSRFQSRMTTAHVGSMHRYTLFQKHGPYDTSYRIVGDYEFLLRPRETLRAAFLPEVTAEMQAGGASGHFAALRETERAKMISGGRSAMVAHAELWIAMVKLLARRILEKLQRKRVA